MFFEDTCPEGSGREAKDLRDSVGSSLHQRSKTSQLYCHSFIIFIHEFVRPGILMRYKARLPSPFCHERSFWARCPTILPSRKFRSEEYLGRDDTKALRKTSHEQYCITKVR